MPRHHGRIPKENRPRGYRPRLLSRRTVLFCSIYLLMVSSIVVGGAHSSSPGDEQGGGSVREREPPPPTFGPDIVINEYLPAPKTTYSTEWVELYNRGGDDVNIAGWYICDSLSRKHTFPAPTIVEPASHILVEKTFGLNNGGDEVRLFNASDGLVDMHTYDDSEYDRSWGRQPDGSGIWTMFTTATPGAPNPGPPRIVINEFMPDPEGTDTDGEWLELYNNWSGAVDLDGWVLTDQDGEGFEFPSVTLPKRSYLIVRESKGTNDLDLSDGFGTVYTKKTSRWSNTGDDVLLTDAGGVGIDYIAYGVSTYIDPPPPELEWLGRWWDKKRDNYTLGLPNPAVDEGCALELTPDGADYDSPKGWEMCAPGGGTPGGDNGRDHTFKTTLRCGGEKAYCSEEDGEMESLEITISPGARTTPDIVIHNTGNVGGYFDIGLGDPGWDEGWNGHLNLLAVELRPGQRTAVGFRVTAPGLGEGSLLHTFVVSVTRRDAPGYADIALRAAVEARLGGVDIVPEAPEVEMGGKGVEAVPEGSVVDVGLRVENDGTEKGGRFALELYLDEVRPKRKFAKLSYDSITPGYAKRPSVELDTLGLPGNHTMIIVADPRDSIAELDEGNNVAHVNISVLPTAPSADVFAVKVAGFYPDTAVPDEPDEHVVLVNAGPDDVNISGWSIGEAGEKDVDRCAVVPEGHVLGPGERLVLARDADAYAELTRAEADLACEGAEPDRRLIAPKGWPALSNTGDEVVLRDTHRHVIDAVHYGTAGEEGDGWGGEAAPCPGEGQLLVRRERKAGGWFDTNSSLDWAPGGRPGMTLLPTPSCQLDGYISIAPGCDPFAAPSHILEEAESEVLIFASAPGELPSPQAVEPCTGRGVDVRIALVCDEDHDPGVLEGLHHAGADLFLIYSDRGNGGVPRQERYRGSYTVIDGATVCFEAPVDDPARPAAIVLDSTGAAGRMAEVFRRDVDPKWEDCERYAPPPEPEPVAGNGDVGPGSEEVEPQEAYQGPSSSREIPLNVSWDPEEGDKVKPLVFPDAGDPGKLLVKELRKAERAVDILVPADRLHGRLAEEIEILMERGMAVRLLLQPADPGDWFRGLPSFGASLMGMEEGHRAPASLSQDEARRWGPFLLARSFERTGHLNSSASEARVLYSAEEPPTGPGGVLAVVDGLRVVWLPGEALEESPFLGGGGEVPRTLGSKVIGSAPSAPFGEMFTRLWNDSPPSTSSTPIDSPAVMFTRLYYDTRIAGEPDESFALANTGGAEADISGWFITDALDGGGASEGAHRFPNGTSLPAGRELVIAREAWGYFQEFGGYPHLLYGGGPDPAAGSDIPPLQRFGKGLSLTNNGDELFLLDPHGTIIDSVVYANTPGGEDEDGEEVLEDSASIPGWTGPPVPLVSEGQLLKRHSPQSTLVPGSIGDGFADTNGSADWTGPRIYRPGQTAYLPAVFTDVRGITVFASPDGSFGALSELLDSAEESIRLAVYQLMSLELVTALANASARGVNVTVLLEGGPVGGVADDEKAAAALLHGAGCRVLYLVSDSRNDVFARYDYLHAKYCVVDGSAVAVMSENWVETGIPFHRSGNRGFGAIVHDEGVAGYFLSVFNGDADVSRKDVEPFDPDLDADSSETTESAPVFDECGPPPPGHTLGSGRARYDYKPRFPAKHFDTPAAVTPVISPDTSVHPGTILGLIEGARREILVEQLEVAPGWGRGKSDVQNLYLEALLDAARGGVEVRILLDSSYAGQPDDYDNADMVGDLRALAEREGLPNLQADLIHLDGGPGTRTELSKIHNKAVIVDSERVLVSSINWVRGAALLNREAGLIIEHGGIARYFREIFSFDWNLSVQRDLSVKVTPSNEIQLRPGTSWNLDLRVAGVQDAGSGVAVDEMQDADRPLILELSAPKNGWEWGLDGRGDMTHELEISNGEESSIELNVRAPTKMNGTKAVTNLWIYAETGGRRCEVGVIRLGLASEGGPNGTLTGASLELVGSDDGDGGGLFQEGGKGKPMLAVLGVLGVAVLLAVGREYIKRGWKAWRGRSTKTRDSDGKMKGGGK